MPMRSMCPSCGFIFDTETSIIPDHSPAPPTREVCAGSDQHARNPDTDRRPLWNGRPNPHIQAAADQFPPGPHTTTTAGPSIRLHDAVVTIDGQPTRVVGTFELVPVGIDWDGRFKSIDSLSYDGAKIIVGSRLNNNDERGLIEPAKIDCSACGRALDYFQNSRHTGTPDGAGGFTCPECTRPPDVPQVVGG